MTAVTPEAFGGLGMASAVRTERRLDVLAADTRGTASWWVDVTRELDDLAESVQVAPGDVRDAPGFTEQIRWDAPHLMGRWSRLAAERDGLYDSVNAVRLLASRNAGDPGAVATVSRAIRDLLLRVRRYNERTSDVLLDAYERDLGGGE